MTNWHLVVGNVVGLLAGVVVALIIVIAGDLSGIAQHVVGACLGFIGAETGGWIARRVR